MAALDPLAPDNNKRTRTASQLYRITSRILPYHNTPPVSQQLVRRKIRLLPSWHTSSCALRGLKSASIPLCRLYHSLTPPHLQTFLYLMSLRTGTTLITLLNTINKVSGLYGILALLTGFSLSSLQLSMYLYSLSALGLLVYLSPHIRQASPLQNLLLAYFYLVDSVINVLYTAFFSLAWFTVLSSSGDAAGKVPGGSTIDETSGFTSPEHNVSHVDVSPSTGEVVGHGSKSASTSGNANANAGNVTTFLQPGTMASLSVIVGLWAIRFYFILVVFAYARTCVRQAIARQGASGATQLAAPSTAQGDLAENPFGMGKELGAGWKGRLGRTLTSFGSSFWLGKEEEGEWVRMELGQRGGKRSKGVEAGTNERERRRRAGTGPSKPGPLQVDVPQK